MKIRNKILLYFLIITFCSVLIIIADSFYNVDSNIVKNAESKLEAIATIQENRIDSEINNHKIQVGLVANRTSLTDDVVNFNTSKDSKYRDSLKIRAEDVKGSVTDYKAVYILDQNGKTITGTDSQKIEEKIDPQKIIFAKEKKQVFIFESENAAKDMVLTAPISRDGKFQGIVLIVTEAGEIQNIMTDYSGLGETGETIVAFIDQNGDAEYVRPPRFANQDSQITIPKEQTNVAAIRSLNKEEGLIKNSVDYRDHPVYAVTEYIDDVDWGLVVKIDKAELYRPIFSHAIQLGVLGSVMIVLIVIVSFFLANIIAKPIEILRSGAEEITKGNLNYNISIDSKDEIGALSQSFKTMMQAIIDSRAEVDKKVQNQTNEIVAKQEYLHDQQKAVLNILEDVEEERNLTAQEKDKVETILQSIGDAVFVVDYDLKIILINPVVIDISGFSAAELVGKKYSDVLRFIYEVENSKIEKVNDKFIKEAIETGQVQEMSNHTVLIDKEGKHIPVADSAAPLKNKQGDIVGCVVVFRDVSKEYAIDKAKTEFVSLASHQLRTPLSAINWYAEMIINGDVGKLTEEQTKYMQEIYKGNQRMINLVNALLDVSRIELGTFAISPEKINIVSLARDLVKEIKLLADQKKILINESYDKSLPEISADPKLLQIIFQNLLSNAVKYTPNKGRVTLTITKKEPNIIIEVKDTGYGIPKAQQGRIYEKLFRADNVRVKDTEGTGLGLYIVKAIVEQANGKISFISKENMGTTFRVEIPLKGMPKKQGSKALEDIK